MTNNAAGRVAGQPSRFVVGHFGKLKSTPLPDVEPQYCLCGCGGVTKMIKSSDASKGHTRGQYFRYLPGHHKRHQAQRNFTWEEDEDGCWLWLGPLNSHGYGSTNIRGRKEGAHVVVYEKYVGPVPKGMELNHICHDEDLSCPGGVCKHRRCVNPSHLLPSTRLQNARGGRKSKITMAQVYEIRERAKTMTLDQVGLVATEYGVSADTIANILTGKRGGALDN